VTTERRVTIAAARLPLRTETDGYRQLRDNSKPGVTGANKFGIVFIVPIKTIPPKVFEKGVRGKHFFSKSFLPRETVLQQHHPR